MPRNLWLLIIGMVINVTGNSFLWPLNAIYIHDHLGKSLSVAGFVLMANAFASVIGNLMGGSLFDKIGGYKTILIGISISLSALIGLTLNHTWIYYVVFLIIIGFGTGIVFPSFYAMAGSVWKEGGRKAFNAIYIAQNVGVAAGSAMGGLVASYSFDYIFLANTLMYILFLCIVLFGFKGIQHADGPSAAAGILSEQPPVKDFSKMSALLMLCFGYLLCWIGYVQWQSTIASYTQEIGISLKQYSILWTINGALIVFAQPAVNLFVNNFLKKVKSQIILGIFIFIGAFVMASYANGFSGFLTAMMVLTIGEMFVWPAVPALADNLAPKGREGFYQGVVNSTATGGRMLGPTIGGILVDFYGMSMMFIVLIILFIIAIMTTAFYDRNLRTNEEADLTPVKAG
ncbi:MFS family permease [Peribacillus deserti]|uniref:MFS family permease n=1 Tax=Peribacillus deserti TaxID=673318 RepID=A0ABS2QIH8_9BACI|nr:MFS transporter [Peribacillus deserti]MBM7692961.1 MFS family permease [Peribacillus deserti]